MSELEEHAYPEPKQRFLTRYYPMITGVALCLAVLSLCAEWLWIGNLLNHLSAHVVLVLLCLVPMVAKHVLPSVLLLSSLCIFSLPWVYQAYEERAPLLQADQESALFMTANTSWWNDANNQAVADALIKADPDFCVVVEAHPGLAAILRRSKQWVHRIGNTRVGPYSLLIITRLELISSKLHVIPGFERTMPEDIDPTLELANKDMLLYEFIVRLQDKDVRVIAAHPPSPLYPRYLKDRSAVLGKIATLVKASPEPCVVLGDFNAIPASLDWRHLHALGVRRPRGLQLRTWMSLSLGFLRQCGLAIDYISTTPGLSMSSLSYVHLPGSDHLAIASEIALSE